MKNFLIVFLFVLLISACNSNHNNKKEIKDSTSTKKETQNPNANAKIDIKVFSNDTVKGSIKLTGFGYNIYMYDAQYIHQPNVPAINGERGFKTKEQAQKAGEFVAYKIKKNIMPPAVTAHELDSLGLLK
jgi:uncharacterized protein YcfL